METMCSTLVQDYINKNIYTYKVFTDINYITAMQDIFKLDVIADNW